MSSAARVQRVACLDGERTWTVLDSDDAVVGPAEQYLEYLRMLGRSPNTVKSYARALALWWQFLAAYDLVWDAVTIEDFGRFLGWLRSGDTREVASIQRRPARFSEQTVAVRLQAVCRCIASSTTTAWRPRRGCMSVCSRAGARTSRCLSTSRAAAASTSASCGSRCRGRRSGRR